MAGDRVRNGIASVLRIGAPVAWISG